MSLEIGSGLVKAVVTEALKGGKHITALITRPVSGQGPDAAAEEVKSLFLSLGFAPESVYLNIPRHLVTARFLKIPSVNDDEIKKMIGMESIKHLPYTDEKIIHGYKVIEKLEDGYSKVLLVIAQASVIGDFIYILNRAGVNGIKLFSLSSEALSSWYALAGEEDGKENTMLINLDSDHIDIDIIEDNKLVFTRGVAYSAEDPKEIEKIAHQIKVSISTYRKESDRSVSRVVLTGAGAETAPCGQALSKELKLPVEVIDQANNIPGTGEDVKADMAAHSFAGLLGLSMRSGDIKINLLPEDAIEDNRLVSAKNNLITAVFLTALLAALAFGLLIKKMHDKYAYLAGVNAELKRIDPKAAAAKKMLKDISVMKEMMARKPLAVDVLSEVCGITPAGISLSALDYESKRSLTVRGTAPALGDMLRYVTALEESPLFEDIKVKYANKRMSENKEITDFEINIIPTGI